VAGSADPMPVLSGQQKCADCKTLIRISPQSRIKDPCLQPTAISNLESAVSTHLNVSLYSQVSEFVNVYFILMASNNPVISCDNVHINHSFLMSFSSYQD